MKGGQKEGQTSHEKKTSEKKAAKAKNLDLKQATLPVIKTKGDSPEKEKPT